MDEENLLPVKKVHLGFAAENEISKDLAAKDVDEESIKNLREQANFVVGICDKIAIRNPLGFLIVRYATCFNPMTMVKVNDEKEKEKKEKRNGKSEQLKNELIALNSQCDNLEDTIQSLNSQFIELARKAEKQNQLTF